MKHNSILIFSILFFFSCNNQPAKDQQEADTPSETAQAQQVSLTEEQMAMADIETGYPQEYLMGGYLQCNGVAEIPPSNLHSIHSKTKGFVGSVRQIIGDYVRKGTVLTTISHPGLVKLQREFLETKTQLAALEKDFTRKKELAAQDAASQKAFEQAEAEYQRVMAHYNGLKVELELLGFSIKKLEEGQVQSSLNIYAPISGYIHSIGINPGKLVNEEDVLYEMVDVEHMHMELRIFAKDLEKVKEGQRIEAVVPGTANTFTGEVHRIGRMIDMEKKTALVHGHFDDDPVDIFPGTYLQAKVFVEEQKVTALPLTGIVREGEKSFIFVKENGGFEKIEIAVGRTDGQYAEVFIPDAEAGKLVVVKGAYYLNAMEGEE